MAVIFMQNEAGAWRRVDWRGPGLPDEDFRVSLREGTREYRPQAIAPAQQSVRQRILALLTSQGHLATGLADLMRRTRQPSGDEGRRDFPEVRAYFFPDGQPTAIVEGNQGGVATGTPPAGTVGYVHTHPVPGNLMAPPSSGDYDLSFGRVPLQLVLEMGGRLWAAYQGRLCSLLGAVSAAAEFQRLNHTPTLQRVYQVVSPDQVRARRFQADEARRREAQQRMTDARRQLAEQRRREAEERRSRLR
jgi:hypothetical protein